MYLSFLFFTKYDIIIKNMRCTMKTYQNMLNQIRRYLPTTPLEVEDQKLMLDYIKA